jgi:DNA polymerase I-like protein with 3'-5' exonuclease and polymerase domains
MLVQIDAAQLEWRVLAWLSGDRVALDEINSGLDFHSKNQEVFGLPNRLIAKIYLFRTIYRGSGWSFANDPAFMGVSPNPDFWDDINEKFYKKYYGINEWHYSLARLCAARKPIVSPLGREWLITPKDDGKLPWTVFTNYPVQGTGADIMMVARISLFRRLSKLSQILLVSTVHDSIVLDCPEKDVPFIGELALSVMDDLPKNFRKLWGIDLPCTFPGEVKYGPTLANMKKFDTIS